MARWSEAHRSLPELFGAMASSGGVAKLPYEVQPRPEDRECTEPSELARARQAEIPLVLFPVPKGALKRGRFLLRPKAAAKSMNQPRVEIERGGCLAKGGGEEPLMAFSVRRSSLIRCRAWLRSKAAARSIDKAAREEANRHGERRNRQRGKKGRTQKERRRGHRKSNGQHR